MMGGAMDAAMMGGGFGVLILSLIANAVLWIVPLYVLLPRAGLSRSLATLGAIPLVGTILLWVLALRRWPGDAARA